ncbi:putative glycolipid-binding domain-containing protein [Halogeometricum luteum]|uniref:Glycolipid-binding domain-containing protein n=1 Tax=Halogeometricum luteum TaxID=2950537 RepID=A0ABU2G0Y6_9EURY|nr:putative glycolipid-binding domain-containing protein [Halogeometricum sp. S3BR5-2]MDS0294452.1 putative glycolipid-binding domain-containing protein [Halogeometricum sp. S3BR5-2]
MYSHYCWEPTDAVGFEDCAVAFTPSLRADGLVVTVGSDGDAARVRYRVRTDEEFRTEAVRVDRFDVGGRDDAAASASLSLAVDGGSWTVDRDPVPELDGCVDVDIAVTPLTNTLPVRRLGLAPGESETIAVAYLDPRTLDVSRAEQRYTRLADETGDGGRYRYESLASGFTATVSVDAAGVVRDYPGLFRRVRSPPLE